MRGKEFKGGGKEWKGEERKEWRGNYRKFEEN